MDQGALLAARDMGFSWGGFCTPSKQDEHGPIPAKFFTEGADGLSPIKPDSSAYRFGDLTIRASGYKGGEAYYGLRPSRRERIWTEKDLLRLRNAFNVRSADVNLIVRTHDRWTPGSKLNARICREIQKPRYVIDVNDLSSTITVAQNVCDKGFETVNIAGPRESSRPGIFEKTYAYICKILYFIHLHQKYQIKIWEPKTNSKTKQTLTRMLLAQTRTP